MDTDEALRAVAESVDGLDAERALADAAHARGRGGLPARPRRVAQPDALLRQARPHGRDRRARPLHGAEHRPARRTGRELVAPGFQPFEVDRRAHHEPRARRRAAARARARATCSRPTPAASRPIEVARVLADTTTEPDPAAAEDALIRLSVAGGAKRAASSATTRSGTPPEPRLRLSSPSRATEPPMG